MYRMNIKNKLVDLKEYFTEEVEYSMKMTRFNQWTLCICRSVGEIIVLFIPITIVATIAIHYLKR